MSWLNAVGNLAGGFTKGYQAQSELQDRQKEQQETRNFRERQLQMQEKDQAYQEEQRERERQSNEAQQAVFQKHYGEREVEEPDPTTGQVVKRKLAASAPGVPGAEGAARDLAFMKDLVATQMGKLKPQELMPLVEFVRKGEATEQGKLVMAAVSNDPKAVARLATALGGDPTKARVIGDKMQFDPGNGKPIDIRNYLYSIGAYEHANMLEKRTELDRKNRLTDAQVAYYGASTGLKNAQAKRQGALAAGGTGSANEVKISAAMLKQLQAVVDKNMGGKDADPEQAAYVLGKAAAEFKRTGQLPSETIAKEAANVREAHKRLGTFMKDVRKMSEADRKAKFKGKTDLDEIRSLTLQGMLGSAPTVSTAPGNLRAVAEDDEE